MAVQFDYTTFNYAFKLLWPGRCSRGRVARDHMGCSAGSACALVHSLIRQIVCFAIVLAQGVIDGEPVQLCNQLFGAAVEFLQRQVFHFVDALDLSYQQLRVADQLERFVSMLNGVLQRCDQALIFREVIGLVTEVLAERGNLSSRFILNYNTVTGGAGIASRAAIAMSDQVVLGWLGGRRGKQTAG